DLSLSQRNMVELVNIFENNGYFFEGETANASWNAPGYMRKRIQAQCDVIVSIGNFIWYGMFSSMTVNNSADTPYFNTFEMNFLAWKERYKTTSPWRDSIHNSVTRGHDAIVMASSHGLKGAPYTPNIGIPSSGASASPTASQVVEAAANTFPSPIPSTFNALLGNPTPLFPKL
ncbi:MAG: hypothetical protein WCQ50_22480, partial [Spirochaetota bacterium]